MASSNSSIPVQSSTARIPIHKTRLPVYHAPPPHPPPPSSSSTGTTTILNIRPKSTPNGSINVTNHTASRKPMSVANRPPPSTSTTTTTVTTTVAPQNRFGFIPRPLAAPPGVPSAQSSTFASRSRSISPTSTVSAHSSSSSSLRSQRVMKTSTNPAPAALQTKTPSIPRPRDSSVSKLNPKAPIQPSNQTPSHLRSRTPSRTSATSSASSTSPSAVSPAHLSISLKTDVNAVRDRYKSQKRMNFFTRRTPISTANGSPMMASPSKSPPPPPPPTSTTTTIPKEKQSPLSSAKVQKTDVQMSTPPKPSSTTSAIEASAHLSQGNRHRQRAISMLSTASNISDVLNQDALLEDDNCSLKSDDLMCDYDETLTMDSTASKPDRTDSYSSISLTSDSQRKAVETKTVTTHGPILSREHRAATIAKCSTTTNGNVRESLDELNRLSHRVDSNVDQEHFRKTMARSVSLKPPSSYLPPLEDAEQITMDIESYRQVMKDVMVVKTILHQLDRLLKHSDGANMTDSMIGSIHENFEPMITSRRFSTSTDPSGRCAIDENTSYEDLLKEIMSLRKEKEQDKQTIKLLQEQMYKYSSHTTNGSS